MEKKAKTGYYNLTLSEPKGKTIRYDNVYLGECAALLKKINESSFISFFQKDELIIVPTLRVYEINEIMLPVCERCRNAVPENEFAHHRNCCHKCLNGDDDYDPEIDFNDVQ